MGFLTKLFGKTKAEPRVAAVSVACPHILLVPRWDNAADMGIEERASGYICNACSESFTLEQAQSLRETEAERLREELNG